MLWIRCPYEHAPRVHGDSADGSPASRRWAACHCPAARQLATAMATASGAERRGASVARSDLASTAPELFLAFGCPRCSSLRGLGPWLFAKLVVRIRKRR